MQMEKEKQNYDFENLQSQLDKALGQSTRMQKERETIQLEVDRLQDKYEKAQVREGDNRNMVADHIWLKYPPRRQVALVKVSFYRW